ncbi:TRPC7-like protein, partial [Mya arenaria]
MPYSNVKKQEAIAELESMSSAAKTKMWRRSNSRKSLLSTRASSTDSTMVQYFVQVDVEDEFLHAAEFGDIMTVRRLIGDNPDLNADCIDVVEILLERSSRQHVNEAVLQAISAGHVQIAESILKHKRYYEIWKDRKKFGDDDHFFKTQFEDSQFSPDITPLILAAQKNQYEIVQLLLLRGERIRSPHKFSCLCQECVNKRKFDQLRAAKHRLNAYKGMASDAYISLSSKDPILTAFQLSRELTQLSKAEKCFKQEYKELTRQLSEYVVKLLDRVRTQDELELVLNKTGKPSEDRYSTLARLKLAVQYKEKKFVSHPSCQQRLDKSWFEGVDGFKKAGFFKRFALISAFSLAYPFLVILYIIAPNANIKVLKPLKYPWVKFAAHTLSFIAFLGMIAVHTAQASYSYKQNHTLGALYPGLFQKYSDLRNTSTSFAYGSDLPVRPMLPSPLQMLISFWILGYLYHECVQLYQSGLNAYISSLYNLMDFTILVVYICSFTLKYVTMIKVYVAILYFESRDVGGLVGNPDGTQNSIYWIVADRFFWQTWDPINLSEGLFAVANVLSFSRISYFLPVNAALGPLQISVGRMIKDILKCLCLIIMVGIAFMVGLQNVYWYYNVREGIEVLKRDLHVPAADAFGDVVKTFRTVFWSVFGRGGSEVVTLGEYDHYLTENFGYLLYGLYNVIMVTVLINMLIAMMARSYQTIADGADVEWKFARSILYLEYMGPGQVLPVPLNLLRIPRAMFEWMCDRCDLAEENLEPPPDLDIYGNDVTNDNSE